MESSKLLDTEFKTMVMRMFKEFSENFNNLKKTFMTGSFQHKKNQP